MSSIEPGFAATRHTDEASPPELDPPPSVYPSYECPPEEAPYARLADRLAQLTGDISPPSPASATVIPFPPLAEVRAVTSDAPRPLRAIDAVPLAPGLLALAAPPLPLLTAPPPRVPLPSPRLSATDAASAERLGELIRRQRSRIDALVALPAATAPLNAQAALPSPEVPASVHTIPVAASSGPAASEPEPTVAPQPDAMAPITASPAHVVTPPPEPAVAGAAPAPSEVAVPPGDAPVPEAAVSEVTVSGATPPLTADPTPVSLAVPPPAGQPELAPEPAGPRASADALASLTPHPLASEAPACTAEPLLPPPHSAEDIIRALAFGLGAEDEARAVVQLGERELIPPVDPLPELLERIARLDQLLAPADEPWRPRDAAERYAIPAAFAEPARMPAAELPAPSIPHRPAVEEAEVSIGPDPARPLAEVPVTADRYGNDMLAALEAEITVSSTAAAVPAAPELLDNDRPPMIIERAQAALRGEGLPVPARLPSPLPGFFVGLSLSLVAGIALYEVLKPA